MTIEERIERLTERHEALTQTVELLAAEHLAMAAENRAMAAENRAGFERLAKVENMLGKVAPSIDTLARVLELPEHRLDTLEGGAS